MVFDINKESKKDVKVLNKNKGITLIALIITIIILLILAGVTIAMLTGENGILNKANNAKTETVKKGALEKVNLAIAGSFDNSGKTDDIQLKTNLENVEGIEKPIADPIIYPLTVKVDGAEITITKDTVTKIAKAEEKREEKPLEKAIVPAGFYHVGGTEAEGFVISDNSADEGKDVNGELLGNQYVWIPVDKTTFDKNFKRTVGYGNNGSLQTYLLNLGEAGADGVNGKVEESETTKQEAKDMYASVKKNGGFYIARYEAGKEIDKVVSKKGAAVWNEIPWSNSETMNVDVGGAVEKARGLDSQNGYTSVTSTLCYSVQWDVALDFIDNNYITNEKEGKPNCDANSYVRKSTGKGNYTGSVAPSGVAIEYQVKNIYDMAGNVMEWTMESEGTSYRFCRGGRYGDNLPSSGRERYYGPSSSHSVIGFRSTLYL